MRPSDLELLAVPGTPALHGTLLLTAVTTPDLGGNTYRGSR